MIFLSDTKIDYGHYLDLYIFFDTKLLINPFIPKLYTYSEIMQMSYRVQMNNLTKESWFLQRDNNNNYNNNIQQWSPNWGQGSSCPCVTMLMQGERDMT